MVSGASIIENRERLLEASLFAQDGGLVGALPRHIQIVAPEVTVRCRLLEDWLAQIEPITRSHHVLSPSVNDNLRSIVQQLY